MIGFREWYLLEAISLIDSAVLATYERAFRQGLEQLIQRTRDPALRQAFEAMRPFRFVSYIISALMRHGIPQRYEPEDCLQRIVFRMLSPVGERGMPRQALFDLDLNRSYNLQTGNPLEARFRTFLANDLRSIARGHIPALRRTERPASLSIGYSAQDQGTVSPDEIPDRPWNHDTELLGDIMELLRRQSPPDVDLVALFKSILAGEGTRVQRARFGHTAADTGRKKIMQIIQQYAQQTQNWSLLRLVNRFQGFDATRPEARPQQARPVTPPKPKYPPDEQDYRSIVDLLERSGRSASMAVFGRARRRWLERTPRSPSSTYANRLTDVLARMVQDGVLAKQGTKYVPGPNYGRYLGTQEPAAVV